MSDKQYKVLLVEDDDAMRDRLELAVNMHPSLKIIGVFSNLTDGLAALETEKLPDVLLTDLGLPDGSGTELIRKARKLSEDMEIMVVSLFGDERNVITAIEAGAAGYLLKDGDTDYIGDAIMRLIKGESPISAAIARHLLKRYRPKENEIQEEIKEKSTSDTNLTSRETEVLSCIAKGYTYGEVASMLGMSTHTVTSHIKKIYRKLEVHSRSEAVFEAVQMGLVEMQTGPKK